MQWIWVLSEHSMRGTFLTIIFACIPHGSVSSSQPLLSLCIHLLQLKRFPWLDRWHLLSPYSPNQLKRLFPYSLVQRLLDFDSLLFFWILSNILLSFLKWRCQTSWQFSRRILFGTSSGTPAVSQMPTFAALVLSLLTAPKFLHLPNICQVSPHCHQLKTVIVVMPENHSCGTPGKL